MRSLISLWRRNKCVIRPASKVTEFAASWEDGQLTLCLFHYTQKLTLQFLFATTPQCASVSCSCVHVQSKVSAFSATNARTMHVSKMYD